MSGHLPELANTSLAMLEVHDYTEQLAREEQALMTDMASARRPSFSSGRYSAQLAQKALCGDTNAVLRHDRSPVWPPSLRGSITHSRTIAAAAVTQADISPGIDIERVDRVTPRLYRNLFSEDEVRHLESLSTHAPTVGFAAKEAIYKATHPLCGQYFGFHDVELRLDEQNGRFAAQYVGDYSPHQMINAGEGYFARVQDHVFALFVLPTCKP